MNRTQCFYKQNNRRVPCSAFSLILWPLSNLDLFFTLLFSCLKYWQGTHTHTKKNLVGVQGLLCQVTAENPKLKAVCQSCCERGLEPGSCDFTWWQLWWPGSLLPPALASSAALWWQWRWWYKGPWVVCWKTMLYTLSILLGVTHCVLCLDLWVTSSQSLCAHQAPPFPTLLFTQ